VIRQCPTTGTSSGSLPACPIVFPPHLDVRAQGLNFQASRCSSQRRPAACGDIGICWQGRAQRRRVQDLQACHRFYSLAFLVGCCQQDHSVAEWEPMPRRPPHLVGVLRSCRRFALWRADSISDDQIKARLRTTPASSTANLFVFKYTVPGWHCLLHPTHATDSQVTRSALLSTLALRPLCIDCVFVCNRCTQVRTVRIVESGKSDAAS
jgi:hypothetical protein